MGDDGQGPKLRRPAHCQDDWETFRLMRTSQMRAWDQPLLDSYLDDLRSAQTEGRNLLCEKYAYMMERTSPAEYAVLRDYLPVPSLEKEWLADWICRNMSSGRRNCRTVPCAGQPGAADFPRR